MKNEKLADEEQRLLDHANETAEVAPAPMQAGCAKRLLLGPHAEAYEEFAAASAELQGKQDALTKAQERYRVALGRFSQLSAAARVDTANER